MGALWWVVLANVAAGPGGPAALSFEGPSVSAAVHDRPALLQAGGQVRQGEASAFIVGQDRVRAKGLTYGDAAQLWVRFQAGQDVYRVELDAAGFPPEQALPPVEGESLRREGPPPPRGMAAGGVALGRAVGGNSGVGLKAWPPRRADLVVSGVGRVYRDDEPLAGRVRIQAYLLPSGVLAPDGSPREDRGRGDPELHVIVEGLPEEASPTGALHFALDGARREGEGEMPMTVDQQWESGEVMLVWREERPAEEEEEEEGEEEEVTPPPAAPAPAPLVESVPPPNTLPIQHWTSQSTPLPPGTPPGFAAATPGAPWTATPSAPPLQTPSAPAAVATAQGSSQLMPIQHSSGLAPLPPGAGGSGFAGAGLPATPFVLNDGRTPPGIGPSTVSPLLTNQPLNAQPAPLTPGNAPPMPGTNPFTGMPQLPGATPFGAAAQAPGSTLPTGTTAAPGTNAFAGTAPQVTVINPFTGLPQTVVPGQTAAPAAVPQGPAVDPFTGIPQPASTLPSTTSTGTSQVPGR